MAVISPSLTLKANAASATTNPGPLSVSLALSASDTLTVDNVESKIITPPHSGAPTQIFDGSGITGTNFTGGTHGGFVYIKNITSTGSNLIYVGIVHAGGAAAPTDPDDVGAAGTELARADDASLRTFTLKPGEFAFFPWDYLGDLYCAASAASQSLEIWRFDRG